MNSNVNGFGDACGELDWFGFVKMREVSECICLLNTQPLYWGHVL